MRVSENGLAFFKNIINTNLTLFAISKEILFEFDSRIKGPYRIPNTFRRGADHINFVRLCINDNEGLYFIRIQKFNKAVIKNYTTSTIRF